MNLEKRVSGGRPGQFKSVGERKIAEFLQQSGIDYRYEQGLLVNDTNMPRIWYPDFFLPEYATYIEYFGMAGDPDYDRGIKHKKKVYAATGINVIALFPWTLSEDWQQYILDELQQISERRLEMLTKKSMQKTPDISSYQKPIYLQATAYTGSTNRYP